MENQEIKWVLDRISISKINYGEKKGQYEGEIRYVGGQGDSFTFRLNEAFANAYLSLIADTVVFSANELGQKIAESIKSQKDGQQ